MLVPKISLNNNCQNKNQTNFKSANEDFVLKAFSDADIERVLEETKLKKSSNPVIDFFSSKFKELMSPFY